MDEMKKVLIVAAVFVLALSLATGAFAQATKGAAPAEQPKVVKERMAVMTATVQAIDLNTRIVTLKGPKGEVRDIKVGEEAVNLPQVKVGDLVTVNTTNPRRGSDRRHRRGAGETAIVRQSPARWGNGCPAVHDGHRTAIDKKKAP
jgi:hypothetical protein